MNFDSFDGKLIAIGNVINSFHLLFLKFDNFDFVANKTGEFNKFSPYSLDNHAVQLEDQLIF